MAKFDARAGQFWLDDQPQLIQAGEFHYFRTPPEAWRHRLGLLQAAGFNAVASYIPWLWHQPEPNSFDFDGHSHPQRDLAGFLDLAAEMGLFIIARPGPYIMAETINEGVPPWFFQHYPQAAYIRQDGQAQNIASYLHPDFLTCTQRWYHAVFEVLTPRQVTRDGKIIMVQLDNEMGMIQWVRNMLDINPDTLARFAAYLAESDEHSADRLRETLADTDAANPETARLTTEYRRFYRRYLREYTQYLCNEATSCGLDVPPVVNIHGFGNGGKTFPIGLSQLVEVMEMDGMVSATDVYPLAIGEGNFHQLLLVNEMTKALHNPEQALFSIEFQAGGNPDFGSGQSSFYDLHTRLCLSNGMRAINHYLFFDGENHPLLSPVKRHDWGHPVRKDGSLRRHYPRYARLSQVLHAYGAALTTAAPQMVAAIGFVLDDFMTEVNRPASQAAANILTHQREVILFDFIARGLALTQRPFQALELSRARLDPAQTPVFWALSEQRRSAQIQQKLLDYVQAGGKLLMVGRLCEQDERGQACTLLRDALGVSAIHGSEAFTQTHIHTFQHEDIPATFVESYRGNFAEIIARNASGATVGFRQPFGAGQVLHLGAALTANTLDDLDILHQMALKLDCRPAFELSAWADVRVSHGEQGSFLFVNNYQDDPLQTTIYQAGQALFGGTMICLPARSGAILPLDWQARPGVLLHYATSEICAIKESAAGLELYTAQPDFQAELRLSGYTCPGAEVITQSGQSAHVRLSAGDGCIRLEKA